MELFIFLRWCLSDFWHWFGLAIMIAAASRFSLVRVTIEKVEKDDPDG
jgi:hypothetical protein